MATTFRKGKSIASGELTCCAARGIQVADSHSQNVTSRRKLEVTPTLANESEATRVSRVTPVRLVSTGFARNLFRIGWDVGTLWRSALRNAIGSPAGFLPDLLLWSKKSASRENAGDEEKDDSSFHRRLIRCRLLVGKFYCRLAAHPVTQRTADLRARRFSVHSRGCARCLSNRYHARSLAVPCVTIARGRHRI